MAAAKAWDREHPDDAAARAELVERLNVVLEDADRRARLTARERDLDRALTVAGCPELALRESLAPRETDAVKAVRAWWGQSERPTLVLCGGVGTGKTTAAVLAARLAVHALHSVSYVRAVEAARVGTWGEGAERLGEWRRCGLLILDDLGVELANEAWVANLGDVVDYRYASSRSVITTNLTPDLLRKRYGERVADRLAQMAEIVGTGTGSMRRQA